MELQIGGHDVQLQLHPTYCSNDDGTILAAVAKYRPLVDWLTKFRSDSLTLSRIIIRNVQWFAQRLNQVTADVELVARLSQAEAPPDPAAKPVKAPYAPPQGRSASTTQTVTFADESAAVLLPVASVGGRPHGVLAVHRRVALGGGGGVAGPTGLEEAFVGSISKDAGNVFVGPGAAALAVLGFPLGHADLSLLRPGELNFGPSTPPCGLVRSDYPTPFNTIAELEERVKEVNESEAAKDDGVVLLVRPLEEIERGRDLKAVVAASLALSSIPAPTA